MHFGESRWKKIFSCRITCILSSETFRSDQKSSIQLIFVNCMLSHFKPILFIIFMSTQNRINLYLVTLFGLKVIVRYLTTVIYVHETTTVQKHHGKCTVSTHNFGSIRFVFRY